MKERIPQHQSSENTPIEWKATLHRHQGKHAQDPGAKGFFVFLVLLTLCLLGTKVVLPVYKIPSASMNPTLHGSKNGGDRVVVDGLSPLLGKHSYNPGDVVVFTAPQKWETHGQTLIKRVIAKGGDTVECCNAHGDYLVNGKAVPPPFPDEDFVFDPKNLSCTSTSVSQRCFRRQTIPEGSVWVMGDNRGNSADSSFWCRGYALLECQGPVPTSNIVGKAKAIIYPFDRIGGL